MDKIKDKLGQVGLLIAAFGIISMVLSIFNYNVRILAWVDLWGDTMGWVIRIGLVVVGGALFFLFRGEEEEE